MRPRVRLSLSFCAMFLVSQFIGWTGAVGISCLSTLDVLCQPYYYYYYYEFTSNGSKGVIPGIVGQSLGFKSLQLGHQQAALHVQGTSVS
jgi:hypothetical protein